jgi:hypothetical protein
MLDLVSAITPDVEFLQVILSGVPFSSERFSRFAERFIFVQVEVPPDEGVKLRMRVEEALDEALAHGDVGRTITGGTGARCSYVVLVVKDLEAVDSVRRALEGLGVPKATWIRFLDDSLSAEWVGVFPDTPPPSD